MFKLSKKVIQITLNNLSNIMKDIAHGPLKICSRIIKTKRKFVVRKCATRKNKCSLMLIGWFNNDLILTKKTIHKGKILASDVVVNNMVSEKCWIIIFWTCSVQVLVVDIDADGTLS